MLGGLGEARGLFCKTLRLDRGGRRSLVVEATPDGGWAWLAWSDDGSGRCLHGHSMTAGHALQAAEHGAEVLNGGAGAEARGAGPGAGRRELHPRSLYNRRVGAM